MSVKSINEDHGPASSGSVPMAASPSRAPTRPPLLAPAVSALSVTLSILAVILGDADRLRQFFFDRSLWNDEVWVGLSVLTRSYGGLLRPLSGEQAAPPGWLWLERFCTQLFGNSELALRLPELLAALALPVLVAVLGHRFLGGWGWLPVAFVALSPYLVFYSAELKPYGPDATFTVLTILLTVCVLDHDLALPWLLWWGGVMAVVAFLSWPALVAVASSAVVIAFRAILPAVRQRRPAQLGWMAIANAPWLAVVAWQYQVILRPLRHNRPLQEFWASGYPSSIRALGSWLRGMIPAVVAQPLSLHLTWLVGVLVIVGATCLLIEQRLAALPMVLVLPVTFVAAALHLYPLEGPPGQPVLQQGRSALSLVPICLILVAGSVRAGALLSGLRRPGHLRTQAWGPLVAAAVAAGTVAATVVVAEPAMASAIGQFGRPTTITESRSAFSQMKRQLTPGEAVFVDLWTASVYAYYAARFRLPAAHLDAVGRGRTCAEGAIIQRLAPSGRFWMAFAVPYQSMAAKAFIDEYLDAVRPVAFPIKDIGPSDNVSMVLLERRSTVGLTPASGGHCLDVGQTDALYR